MFHCMKVSWRNCERKSRKELSWQIPWSICCISSGRRFIADCAEKSPSRLWRLWLSPRSWEFLWIIWRRRTRARAVRSNWNWWSTRTRLTRISGWCRISSRYSLAQRMNRTGRPVSRRIPFPNLFVIIIPGSRVFICSSGCINIVTWIRWSLFGRWWLVTGWPRFNRIFYMGCGVLDPLFIFSIIWCFPIWWRICCFLPV